MDEFHKFDCDMIYNGHIHIFSQLRILFYYCCNICNAVDRVETLKRYKFSLAFETSNEEDYVTEKFCQSLVAGTKICYKSLSVGVADFHCQILSSVFALLSALLFGLTFRYN